MVVKIMSYRNGSFAPFNAGTVFRRQNMTFVDVRFLRLQTSDSDV